MRKNFIGSLLALGGAGRVAGHPRRRNRAGVLDIEMRGNPARLIAFSN